MIIITGAIDLKPQSRDAAIALGCKHSARSRQEVGCISHNCYIDAENENRLHFFEQWTDMEAVQQHFAVPESAAFVQKVSSCAVTTPEIAIFEAEPTGSPKI